MERLICSVCFEPYNMGGKQPKTLKCGHTFCRGCLLLWYNEQKRIVCPNDETKYYEEVDSLPDNQAIKNMLMDLEVHCPRHGQQVEDFCTTHLALCCSQCDPHGPGCTKKNFVEDTNEITNILIKTIDDVHNGIGILPQMLKESYDKRFKQKIGVNVELLYKLRKQKMGDSSLLTPYSSSQYNSAGPQMPVHFPAPMYSPQLARQGIPVNFPSAFPSSPTVSMPGGLQSSPLPSITLSTLDLFHSVLPKAGTLPANLTGNNKGWRVNFQRNQVEVVTMSASSSCVLTGIALANPIQPGAVAIVESVSLYNDMYAYGNPICEHRCGEQLVGGDSVMTYINFYSVFPIPERTKVTLKVKIVCSPYQRVGFVDLYRGNPFDRSGVWAGSDQLTWEFEDAMGAGEGEFVIGQTYISGPILRLIYRR